MHDLGEGLMAELFGELDEVDEGGEKDVRAVRIRVGKVFGIEVLYSSGGR